MYFTHKTTMNIQELSSSIRKDIGDEVEALKNQGIFPKLSVILVWWDESAIIYAQAKKKVADQLWIQVDIDLFPEDVPQDTLEKHILSKSIDDKVHGILLESPFPKGLDYNAALNKVHPTKDIDGLHEVNQGKLQNGDHQNVLLPATPLACMILIESLVGNVVGKNIVVVWRGRTVGKPLANMLIQKWATVTVANSHTENFAWLCKSADIIVSATGQQGIITADMVHAESIVIDAWISTNEEWKIIWDVDYESVSKIATFTTPVPGWVGMITTGMVFQNLIKAAYLQKKIDHFDLPLNQFIELASWSNMPGGGGISAVVGILGAAMTSMLHHSQKINLYIEFKKV